MLLLHSFFLNQAENIHSYTEKRAEMKQKILNAAMYTFLFAVFIWAVFPIIYVILSSFKSNTEIMAIPESILPKSFTFKNYQNAWNSEFMNIPRMLWNSIWFT